METWQIQGGSQLSTTYPTSWNNMNLWHAMTTKSLVYSSVTHGFFFMMPLSPVLPKMTFLPLLTWTKWLSFHTTGSRSLATSVAGGYVYSYMYSIMCSIKPAELLGNLSVHTSHCRIDIGRLEAQWIGFNLSVIQLQILQSNSPLHIGSAPSSAKLPKHLLHTFCCLQAACALVMRTSNDFFFVVLKGQWNQSKAGTARVIRTRRIEH